MSEATAITRHALIIDGGTDLPASITQNLFAADVLKDAGYKIHSATLIRPEEADTYAESSPEGLRKLFANLKTEMREGDELLVLVNSHGTNIRGNISEFAKDLPADSPLRQHLEKVQTSADPRSYLSLGTGRVSEEEFARYLKGLPAGQRIFIMHTCFGGNWKAILRNDQSLFLAKGGENQIVYDSDFLFWSALEAVPDINNSGRIEIEEIIEFFKGKDCVRTEITYVKGKDFKEEGFTLNPDKRDRKAIASGLCRMTPEYMPNLLRRTQDLAVVEKLIDIAAEHWNKTDYLEGARQALATAFFNLYSGESERFVRIDDDLLTKASRINDRDHEVVAIARELLRRGKPDLVGKTAHLVSHSDTLFETLVANDSWDEARAFMNYAKSNFKDNGKESLADKIAEMVRDRNERLPGDFLEFGYTEAKGISSANDCLDELLRRREWESARRCLAHAGQHFKQGAKNSAANTVFVRARREDRLPADLVVQALLFNPEDVHDYEGLVRLLIERESTRYFLDLFAKLNGDGKKSQAAYLAKVIASEIRAGASVSESVVVQAALCAKDEATEDTLVNALLQSGQVQALNDYAEQVVKMRPNSERFALASRLPSLPAYDGKNPEHAAWKNKIHRSCSPDRSSRMQALIEARKDKDIAKMLHEVHEKKEQNDFEALSLVALEYAEKPSFNVDADVLDEIVLHTEDPGIFKRAYGLLVNLGPLERAHNPIRNAIKDKWNEEKREAMAQIILEAQSSKKMPPELIRDASRVANLISTAEKLYLILLEGRAYAEANEVIVYYAAPGWNNEMRMRLSRKLLEYARSHGNFPSEHILQAFQMFVDIEVMLDLFEEFLRRREFDRAGAAMDLAHKKGHENLRDALAKLVCDRAKENKEMPDSLVIKASQMADSIDVGVAGLQVLLEREDYPSVKGLLLYAQSHFNEETQNRYADAILNCTKCKDIPADLVDLATKEKWEE